jgi:hypothetical protein
MWRLKITKTNNGYLLEGEDIHMVVEEKDPTAYDLEVNPEFEKMDYESAREKMGLKDLLQEIAEYFGYQDDKYGKYNLKISFDRPGRKVDDSETSSIDLTII